MSHLLNSTYTATAYAPATCANVAVGYDILGFACQNLGDYITVTRCDQPGLKIEEIISQDLLPTDIDKNVASAVIAKVCQDLELNVGLSITLEKQIPLASGLGGSAASAVAALTAFNALLVSPLNDRQLLEYALYGESIAAGSPHADNVAPCLYGGLTLILQSTPHEVIQLPTADLYCTLLHTNCTVNTRDARQCLPDTLSLTTHIKQSSYLAGFISAIYSKNYELMRITLNDIVVEPHRSHLIDQFAPIQQAAKQAGALGASLSGSGPTIFALSDSFALADKVAEAMQSVCRKHNINHQIWTSPIGTQGAHITHIEKNET